MLNTVYTQNKKAVSPKKNNEDWTELVEADVFEHLTLPRALTLGSKQINQDTGLPNMFVGDRGHGFGSRIKGHRRFGGFWKQQRHGRYAPTLIPNEHNTSQTCVFCFHKLFHPVAAPNGKIQRTAGSFLCLNPKFPNAFKTVCRDQVSALGIGLVGLGCLLFGVTFLCFNPNPTTAKRTQFNNLALSFLYRKQILGLPFDGGNTL
ncbi:hypothetical protein BD408DRAFT_409999 [Parasitella parasitica]|nr:hypothetical protein BD408DRAFT_409999 [Parasitella parasitica]